MRLSYAKGFILIIGLEGKDSDDPQDPGGYTRYGICQKYNPEVDVKNLTLEQAKNIYYRKYWEPAGCNDVPYPMDICLFDGAVNPQKGGNKEILNQNPENWQEFLLLRAVRYMEHSKDIYVKGHVFRVLRLFKSIYRDIQSIEKLKETGY
jgi:lysozyme family protein